MNENMKTMGESLKRLHEGPNRPNFGNAEAAKKPKRCSEATASTSGESDPTPDSGEDSDSEQLLDRPNTDEKEENVPDDTLLDEISRHLEGEEETSGPLPAKLAEIIEKRWHNKLAPNKLTEKLEKYLKPENCKLTCYSKGQQKYLDQTGQRGQRQRPNIFPATKNTRNCGKGYCPVNCYASGSQSKKCASKNQ